MKKVIGTCPVCHSDLYVKTLKCSHCEVEVSGELELSPFDKLSKEMQDFALVFIKHQGNIKAVEKSLNISYPTVKKNLDELCRSLGFRQNNLSRSEVARMLKEGEIDLEEAEELLGGL